MSRQLRVLNRDTGVRAGRGAFLGFVFVPACVFFFPVLPILPNADLSRARTRRPPAPRQVLSDKYTLGKELGRGQFGVAYLCVKNDTGEKLAAKTIAKTKLQ